MTPTCAPPTGGPTTVAPDRNFRVAIVGAGMSGIAVGPSTRPGRRRLRDPREERRRRRDLVGEPVPGVPGRRAEPLLQLLVRADAGVAAVLRLAVEPPRLLPHLRGPSSASASTCASTPRWSTRRGTTSAASGASRCDGPDGADAVEANALVERGRPAQPAQPARPPRHRPLRRPVVPLGPLGSRRRARREAGRDHRHRRERGAVHPRGRRAGRAPDRVPAHAAVAARHAQLPRRPPERDALAARARPRLRELGPRLDLLALPRGDRADGRGRPRRGTRPSR